MAAKRKRKSTKKTAKRKGKAPFQKKGSPAAKAHGKKMRAALKRLIAKGRSCGKRKSRKKK